MEGLVCSDILHITFSLYKKNTLTTAICGQNTSPPLLPPVRGGDPPRTGDRTGPGPDRTRTGPDRTGGVHCQGRLRTGPGPAPDRTGPGPAPDRTGPGPAPDRTGAGSGPGPAPDRTGPVRTGESPVSTYLTKEMKTADGLAVLSHERGY